MNIEIEKSFIGYGEVKDFIFNQVDKNEFGYIYSVEDDGKMHYEVFEKRSSQVCIDFIERIYSETETRDVYPKANAFGVWAFTCTDLDHAYKYFKNFKSKEK